MEPNTRDTPMRRCTTVVWGVALMLAVGIGGVLLYPLFNPEVKHIDEQAQDHSKIKSELKKVHESQAKTKAGYKYDIDKAAEKLAKEVAN